MVVMELWNWSEISYWRERVTPEMSAAEVSDRFTRYGAGAVCILCFPIFICQYTGGEGLLDMC